MTKKIAKGAILSLSALVESVLIGFANNHEHMIRLAYEIVNRFKKWQALHFFTACTFGLCD
jgi:hypothetical protein